MKRCEGYEWREKAVQRWKNVAALKKNIRDVKQKLCVFEKESEEKLAKKEKRMVNNQDKMGWDGRAVKFLKIRIFYQHSF